MCGGHSELVEHVVRDCPLAAAVWFVTLGLHVHQVHELSLKAWVSQMALTFPPPSFELLLSDGFLELVAGAERLDMERS